MMIIDKKTGMIYDPAVELDRLLHENRDVLYRLKWCPPSHYEKTK